MKAEQIIMTDIKETLKYDGPVFLKWGDKVSNRLLEVKNQYCPKCKKKTSQEWVRNRDFHYWRCSECLERHIKAIDIATPTSFCNKVSHNLEV